MTAVQERTNTASSAVYSVLTTKCDQQFAPVTAELLAPPQPELSLEQAYFESYRQACLDGQVPTKHLPEGGTLEEVVGERWCYLAISDEDIDQGGVEARSLEFSANGLAAAIAHEKFLARMPFRRGPQRRLTAAPYACKR